MAHAVIHDIACSWLEYEQAWCDTREPLPIGLLVHVAGPTDEGVRLIDIWAGEQPASDPHTLRLAEVIETVGSRAAMRDFRPVHVIFGGHRLGTTDDVTPSLEKGSRR